MFENLYLNQNHEVFGGTSKVERMSVHTRKFSAHQDGELAFIKMNTLAQFFLDNRMIELIDNRVGHTTSDGNVKHDFNEEQNFRNLILFIYGHEQEAFAQNYFFIRHDKVIKSLEFRIKMLLEIQFALQTLITFTFFRLKVLSFLIEHMRMGACQIHP